MTINHSIEAALRELKQAGVSDITLSRRRHHKLQWRVNGGNTRTYVISASPSDAGNLRVVRGGIRRLLRADGLLSTERSDKIHANKHRHGVRRAPCLMEQTNTASRGTKP
jgi:hypothetical protein